MFHGWMFDPDGDQAAADSTRSSTSLDTGSSVNPRTACRLLTASYASMIAYRLEWPGQGQGPGQESALNVPPGAAFGRSPGGDRLRRVGEVRRRRGDQATSDA